MTSPSGMLLVDKPVGPTSHDAVAMIRRSTGVRRVGHAGTLDPFASGLLLVLLGSATRLSEYLHRVRKGYLATVILGVSTDTDDREGEVIGTSDDWSGLSRPRVEASLGAFVGSIAQIPPAYSAKKVRGQPAHRRIRRGETVSLDPVEVEVHAIELTEIALPEVSFSVSCSAGTYVRALARDLGEALGVFGHLAALRRTRIGGFTVDEALAWRDLEQAETTLRALRPPSAAVSHLPEVHLAPDEAVRFCMGQPLPISDASVPEGTPLAVLLGGELLAVGAREGEELRPRKVLAHA